MRDLLKKRITEALAEAGVSGVSDIQLEHPSELQNGDYSTSVALKYAKDMKMQPRVLAERIVAELGTMDGIAKIEVARTGFINFFLDTSELVRVVEAARTEDMWGSNADLAGEQVLIEYTSPNLFKPLHIGNLVGNVIGESISRLLQFCGAHVMRINYPSDIGLTVAKGVWGLQKTSGDPNDIAALGTAYRAGNEAYENNPSAKQEIETINKKLYERADPVLNALRERGIETSRRHLDELCRKLGTTFDAEIFESEAAPVGKEIVERYPNMFPISEGAHVFHGSHTRVFLNSHGLPTYEAKDLGNFVLKQKRYPAWHRYVVVTGVEQKEYFKVLYEAISTVFPETEGKTMRHVATGFLTLTTGKMSSRLGNVLTGESLFLDLEAKARERAAESRADDSSVLSEEIAVAALKYEILKTGTGRNIVFDRERALSLEGDSGPYLQYAHARASAIVDKAHEQGVAVSSATLAPNDLSRLLHRFPEVVEYAASEYEPHVLTNYLLQLASGFNSWYAQVHILDGSSSAPGKVALVEAMQRTLQKGLWILGIPAPKKM